MASGLCDRHLAPFREGLARITFRSGGEEYAFCCEDPTCDRHYSPSRGYFSAEPGENPDFGTPSKRPHCMHNAEASYMFLALKDGEPMWVCPHDDRQVTRTCVANKQQGQGATRDAAQSLR
jgi:hypothetical protein